MSQLFAWTEKYTVKVASLDRQHQKLFSIADRLQQALGTGKSNSVIDATLKELVKYTVTHFSAEEGLLRTNGYPELSKHLAEHADMKRKLTELQQQYAGGNRDIAGRLMMFLIHWLKSHILDSDRRYADFLNSRGVH